RVTPHNHAPVERKLGYLLRSADRIERRTRFTFADEVRMRATLFREGVIGRDYDPATHQDSVAFRDAFARRRQKRWHAFLQQTRRGVPPGDSRPWAGGRMGRREHRRDRRCRCVVVHRGCIKDAPTSDACWQYYILDWLALQ